MGDDRTLTVGSGGAAPTPDRVSSEAPGRYERREELGRGGIGRVVAAWDHHLGREVALKELLDGDNGEAAARFVREARVMARLEHPGIVPVHEIGRRSDGSLYYTMRRVRGTSFAEALAARPDDRARRDLLDTFLGVCRTMAHAHDAGVTHRDIKPANLMIGERGEALVLDWGLAGEADGSVATSLEGDLTLAGTALGTPAYMSPEQARGERVDPRTDCWALGLVLYEIVEGRRADRNDPVITRAPAELAAVLRRALAVDPAERYPNAGVLLDDLLAWRDNARVSAHSYTLGSELRRLARRHARPLGLGVAALGAIAAIGAFAGARVLRERDRAARAESELTAALARALEDRAQKHLLDGDPAAAAIVAAEGLRLATSPGLSGIAAAALGRETPILAWEAQIAPDAVAVEWSPDGPWLLVAWAFHAEVWRDGERVLVRSSDDVLFDGAAFGRDAAVWLPDRQGLERYDLRTGTSTFVPLTDAPIAGDSRARRVVAIHEEGGDLYLGREDFTVERVRDGEATVLPWRTPTRRRGWTRAGAGHVWLAEAEDGPALRDLADGRLVARVPFRPVHHLADAGAWRVASSRRTWGNTRLAVFDEAGVVVADAPGLPGGNAGVAPAGEAAWVAGGGPLARRFALPSLAPDLALRHGGERAVGAAWSDGRLAIATVEGRLTVWDAPPVALPAGGPIHGLAVRDGQVWTLGAQGQLARDGAVLPPLPDPGRLFVLSDASLLASDRDDLLWLGDDGAVARRSVGLGEILAVAEDRGLLAVGGGHQEVGLLDRATRETRWISGHLGTDVVDLAWDEAEIRSVHLNGDVQFLAPSDGTVVRAASLGARLHDAATAPDGRWIASATTMPAAIALHDRALAPVATAPLPDAALWIVWIDQSVYVATFDGSVHAFRVPDLAPLAVVPLESGQIRALAADGDCLLAAGASGQVHRVALPWLAASADAIATEAGRRFGLRWVAGEIAP